MRVLEAFIQDSQVPCGTMGQMKSPEIITVIRSEKFPTNCFEMDAQSIQNRI